MDNEFWINAWDEGNIGFHQSKVNNFLENYAKKTFVKNKNIFVPLCGKSLDMIWLKEQGHPVIGVEISKKAIIAFFNENSLSYTLEKTALFDIYLGENIKIYHGSFFDLKKEDVGDCDIYDRASMVALPRDMRDNYSKKIIELASESTNILLQTFEHEEDIVIGPPFSISKNEVGRHYSEKFMIEELQRAKRPLPERYKDVGVKKIEAILYHLRPRD